MNRRAASLLAVLVVISPPVAAQNYRDVTDLPVGPRALIGINLQVGVPQGEFRDFVGTGYGAGGNLTWFVDRSRRVGVRLFFSWIQYGRTTERLPLSPTLPGLLVDLTTANDIYSFGLGPEFQLASGSVRPYLHAAIGTSNFATTTSAEGTNNSNSFASTTNFNDWTFAWYGGGGLQFQVSHGRTPVWIDGGLRYQSHGQTRYLREGSITPTTGGGVSFTPIESKTDLLIVHVGVQVGI